MSNVPERPELLCAELWRVPPRNAMQDTIGYIDVDGQSPEITNHLSSVTFEIIEGCGSIATAQSVSKFDLPSSDDINMSVYIPVKRPYMYEGKFSAFVSYRVPPYLGFVTLNGERLGRTERKALRKVSRRVFFADFIKNIDEKFDLSASITAISGLLMPNQALELPAETTESDLLN